MSFLQRIGSGIVAGWHAGHILRRMLAGEISVEEAAEFRRSPEHFFERRVQLPVLPEDPFSEEDSRGVVLEKQFLVERYHGKFPSVLRLYRVPCAVRRSDVLRNLLEDDQLEPADAEDLASLLIRHQWRLPPDEPLFAIGSSCQCRHGEWFVLCLREGVISSYPVNKGFDEGSLFVVRERQV